MKRILVLSLLLVSTLASPVLAQQHHYYPLAPGNFRLYVNELDPSLTVTMSVEAAEPGLALFTRETRENGVAVETLRLKCWSDAEGDVYVDAIDFGEWLPFTPPYFLIDAPLSVGKTWSTSTVIPGVTAVESSVEVLAEEMVTTPVGTFYSYHVHYVEVWELFGTIEENYWFVDGLGQSKFYVAGYDGAFLLSEATVVPIESKSWGSVKALFSN